jgi:hypothetical protein
MICTSLLGDITAGISDPVDNLSYGVKATVVCFRWEGADEEQSRCSFSAASGLRVTICPRRLVEQPLCEVTDNGWQCDILARAVGFKLPGPDS